MDGAQLLVPMTDVSHLPRAPFPTATTSSSSIPQQKDNDPQPGPTSRNDVLSLQDQGLPYDRGSRWIALTGLFITLLVGVLFLVAAILVDIEASQYAAKYTRRSYLTPRGNTGGRWP